MTDDRSTARWTRTSATLQDSMAERGRNHDTYALQRRPANYTEKEEILAAGRSRWVRAMLQRAVEHAEAG